jgi:hypothetical protein
MATYTAKRNKKTSKYFILVDIDPEQTEFLINQSGKFLIKGQYDEDQFEETEEIEGEAYFTEVQLSKYLDVINQITNKLIQNDGHCISYQAAQLKFIRPIIEKLKPDECFCIKTPYGIFRFTKKEFEETFPNVVQSKAYKKYEYHYAGTPPKAADKFRVTRC